MTSPASVPPALGHIIRAIEYLKNDTTQSDGAILKAFAYGCFGHQAFVAPDIEIVRGQAANVMRVLNQNTAMAGPQDARMREAAGIALRTAVAELRKTDDDKARALEELMKTELTHT